MEKIYSNELIINMSCFKIHHSVVQSWCEKENASVGNQKYAFFVLVPCRLPFLELLYGRFRQDL